MATRRQEAEKRPAPRLYLVTERIDDAAAWARVLAAALAGADIAAVLLSLGDGDERSLDQQIATLSPAVQGCGAALLTDGHPEIAARAAADGAHLSGAEALRGALPILKPERIAGAGGLATRHDAMLAAEAGADYVMFGEPTADGDRPPFPAVVERVAWWSGLFEVPCVGFAANMDEVRPLAQAGAEFVALGPFVWRDPHGAAAAIASAGQALGSVEWA